VNLTRPPPYKDATLIDQQELNDQLIVELSANVRDLEERLKQTNARLNAIETSTIWRSTAGLRSVFKSRSWFRRLLRQSIRRPSYDRPEPAAALVVALPAANSPAPDRGPEPAVTAREKIILVVHETSRTGAPILGWNIARHLAKTYDIYTVIMDGGVLTPEFAALSAEIFGPFNGVYSEPADVARGTRALFGNRIFKYAIINGILSRAMLEICTRHGVPTLLLIHEFGSTVWPVSALRQALDGATRVIFPARIVAESSTSLHEAVDGGKIHIMPQGRSIIPSDHTARKMLPGALLAALFEARAQNTFFILGAGSVGFRKGVDLFIAAAAAVRRLNPTRPIRFIWVGAGYLPNDDMAYSIFLKEQIERSELERHVQIFDEVSDLEPFYELAHLFLLSSRLDPLPNVGIDAAHQGLPILCYGQASGIAELLEKDRGTAGAVLPHLDIAATAALIVELSGDEEKRVAMSNAVRALAGRVFDMAHYVESLDRLAAAVTVT
jgi:glycosyltransferase involved in cell wall biosynthesis